MSEAAEGQDYERLARSLVESVPVSPGMLARVDPGPLGEALAGELETRGLVLERGGGAADVVFVTDGSSPALERALAGCRERGLVVHVGDGPVDRLDLYPEVHRNGLRLTFRSLDDDAVATDRADGS